MIHPSLTPLLFFSSLIDNVWSSLLIKVFPYTCLFFQKLNQEPYASHKNSTDSFTNHIHHVLISSGSYFTIRSTNSSFISNKKGGEHFWTFVRFFFSLQFIWYIVVVLRPWIVAHLVTRKDCVVVLLCHAHQSSNVIFLEAWINQE